MKGQSQQQIQIYFILTKFLTQGRHLFCGITVQNLKHNAQAVTSLSSQPLSLCTKKQEDANQFKKQTLQKGPVITKCKQRKVS